MSCTCASSPTAGCTECATDVISQQEKVVAVLQKTLMRDVGTHRVRDLATALAMSIDKLHFLRTGGPS